MRLSTDWVRRLRTAWVRHMRVLPSAILVAVALHQLQLAHAAGLSAWSGGGFGMFSTTDAGATRHLHAFQIRPGVVRELTLPDSLDDLRRRALTLPSESNLRKLAAAVASLPAPDHGAPTAVRIQVWRTRFDSQTRAPSSHIVGALELPLVGD